MKKNILFLALLFILGCKDYEKISEENKKLLDNGKNQEVIDKLSIDLTENPNFADGFNLRGVAFLNIGNGAKALEDFNSAIKLNSENYKYFYNRGNIYRQTSQLDDALADYDKALALNPNIADLYTNKGAVLVLMNRNKEALATLNKAISLNPSDKNALFNRGQINFLNEDFDKAIADLHHCVELAPDLAKAHYLLAISEITKNKEKASPESCQHLQKAVELGFSEAIEASKKYCQ
jgi:tetratricopeptide (TPR) repeat protein